jgi:p-aminobenzoyl-glutamate transporter AbgT
VKRNKYKIEKRNLKLLGPQPRSSKETNRKKSEATMLEQEKKRNRLYMMAFLAMLAIVGTALLAKAQITRMEKNGTLEKTLQKESAKP